MNINRNSSIRGNTLILTVVVTGLIGFLLAAYLGLVKSQNVATMRSQAWNASIPVIEAGIEDALTHINTRLTNELTGDGWEKRGNIYITRRWVGQDYYDVTISNWVVGMVSNSPIIESRGYVVAPLIVASAPLPFFANVTPSIQPSESNKKYVARGIRCKTVQDWLFSKGMVAKGPIDLNGRNIETDSFDSSDPLHSTNGVYDASTRKDNGDIATNSGVTNSLSIGNAQIYGRVSTGPGGLPDIGPQGCVGDFAFHTVNPNQGDIQTGYFKDDMNVDFSEVKNPFTGGWSTPGPEVVDGVAYAYVLRGPGDYVLTDLTLSGVGPAAAQMLIIGENVRLKVMSTLDITGNGAIIISTNSSLQMFVYAPVVNLGGNGVINYAGNALDFEYWGMKSNTKLNFFGNGTFTGTIYAPEADFNLVGSGSTTYDFMGASITKSVTMNGNFRFHYDEALAKYGPPRGYIVTSWDEMTPTEVAQGPTW
ncbi:MAG: hypothetical protein L0Y58_18110 [Verrucomicrobia subdivision 3 bacterium]|nr:hypothetical protein [Limisphaerales bacterium]